MEFIDVQAQYRFLKNEIDAEMAQVLQSGHFIMGPQVPKFESELADYVGVRNVVGCGNGTDALQLLYMALDVKKDDAVFVPDVTFIATHEPACMFGAVPVFCDIDPVSYNLSPQRLEERIIEVKKQGKYNPRFIVGVDFLGNPCDWDALKAVADKYGLILIEDAAQGIGGSTASGKAGSFGVGAATSFFPTKPLACFGDGGAVMTNDDALAEKLRSLRVHGKGSSKYDNVRIGVNSRLDTLQAAVLSVKLRHLDEENAKRREVAGRYTEALKDKFVTPVIKQDCVSAFAQYAIIARDNEQRQAAVSALSNAQIPSLVYYPTEQHAVPVFAHTPYACGEFPESHRYVSCSLCLPFSPYLTQQDQQKVIEALLKI